jgi:hypothetical protein
MTLSEFASEQGQIKAAEVIGMRQSSLSKALAAGRAVFVTEHDDGTFSAEEVKPFPSQAAKQQGEVRP